MKMTSIKIDTYDISDEKDGYMIDIVTTDEDYEAWIYHKDYTDKQFMYSCSKEQETYESFIKLVTMGNIKGHIKYYQNTYIN